MTVVLIGRIEDLPKNILGLPKGAREYILSASSAAVRRERYSAYRLLSALIRRCFSADVGELTLMREGDRPYLTRNVEPVPFDFNLSHSGDFVCAALTDRGRIGVDIEKKITEERAERLEKRFSLSKRISGAEVRIIDPYSAIFPPDYVPPSTGEKICKAELCRENLLFGFELDGEKERKADTETLSFTERWTVCESALKRDGRGMSGVGSLAEVLSGCSVYTFSFTDGGCEYSLAVSATKD